MIRVRISSEDAGMIAMTPVVAQDMELRELIDVILGSTGKDAVRILELLKRGTTVHGLSRYRWQPVELDPQELAGLLATFPDADNSSPFRPALCSVVTLIGSTARISIPREAAAKRRFLKKDSFWSRLLDSASQPAYSGYSYREKADVYKAAISPDTVRSAADLLTYPTLVKQLQASNIDVIEFFIPRV
jgi:hypothetical protein